MDIKRKKKKKIRTVAAMFFSQAKANQLSERLNDFRTKLQSKEGRKHGTLRPQRPLRLFTDREAGGRELLYLTPSRYAVTTRMTLQ